MIDPATAASLARIGARERDVLGAYRPGFTPEFSDIAGPPSAAFATSALSVAAPDGTYFMTQDASGKVLYSRDGALTLAGGTLVTPGCEPVLGFAPGQRARLGPLRVDPYDAALGRVSDVRVERDGTCAYTRTAIDPRSGERRVERVGFGRLALARFPAGTQPERVDAVHVRAPHDVAARVGVPGERDFGGLGSHARDLGRVDIIAGLEKLQDAYVSFEALRTAHHASGTLEKTAMDLLK